MGDYKTKLFNEISRIETVLKRDVDARTLEYAGITYNLAERGERMALINVIADEYIAAHAEFNHQRVLAWQRKKDTTGKGGEYPPAPVSVDVSLLDRLTDAVLAEELKSTYRAKASEEYPFFSDRQLKRRTDGEAPMKAAALTSSDGANNRMPTRRKRSDYENIIVDKRAKIRNAERKAQYKRDTSPGEVVAYTVSTDEIALYLEEKYGNKLATV